MRRDAEGTTKWREYEERVQRVWARGKPSDQTPATGCVDSGTPRNQILH